MRQNLIRASDDMAGLSSFTTTKIKNWTEMVKSRGKVSERHRSALRLFVEIIFSFQFEISAEVEFPHLVVLGQFFRSSLFENFPFDQKVSPVANRKRFSYIMVSDQHADV